MHGRIVLLCASSEVTREINRLRLKVSSYFLIYHNLGHTVPARTSFGPPRDGWRAHFWSFEPDHTSDQLNILKWNLCASAQDYIITTHLPASTQIGVFIAEDHQHQQHSSALTTAASAHQQRSVTQPSQHKVGSECIYFPVISPPQIFLTFKACFSAQWQRKLKN